MRTNIYLNEETEEKARELKKYGENISKLCSRAINARYRTAVIGVSVDESGSTAVPQHVGNKLLDKSRVAGQRHGACWGIEATPRALECLDQHNTLGGDISWQQFCKIIGRNPIVSERQPSGFGSPSVRLDELTVIAIECYPDQYMETFKESALANKQLQDGKLPRGRKRISIDTTDIDYAVKELQEIFNVNISRLVKDTIIDTLDDYNEKAEGLKPLARRSYQMGEKHGKSWVKHSDVRARAKLLYLSSGGNFWQEFTGAIGSDPLKDGKAPCSSEKLGVKVLRAIKTRPKDYIAGFMSGSGCTRNIEKFKATS